MRAAKDTIPAPAHASYGRNMPFRIAYRLRLRRPVAYGIRYGIDAQAVRASLLIALRAENETAVVISVEPA